MIIRYCTMLENTKRDYALTYHLMLLPHVVLLYSSALFTVHYQTYFDARHDCSCSATLCHILFNTWNSMVIFDMLLFHIIVVVFIMLYYCISVYHVINCNMLSHIIQFHPISCYTS